MANPSARRLRDLMASDALVVIPSCINPLTALIAQDIGFDGVYLGGAVVAAHYFGLPDFGVVSTSEMIEAAHRIADVVDIPLICDADQAGETYLNVYRTVREYDKAGAAGIHIEDSRNPKHTDAATGSALIPAEVMQDRLRAALDGRINDEFVIIARSDELFNKGSLDEAIRRGQAYAEAGADLFMPIAMKPSEIDLVAKEVPIPIVDISHAVADVQATQLKFNVITRFIPRGLAFSYESMMRELKEHGEFADADQRMISAGRLGELVGQARFKRLVEKYS